MKSFTFRLPVKKHIQKYLTSLYGETIPAQMETDIGFVVLQTLASRIESKVCRGYNNQWSQDPYQAVVTFTVPYHYFYLTKKELSIYTCILLNRYFENKFEEDLSRYVEMRDTEGRGKYKGAIEAFADYHGISIEEDISFDTLKKMEYRFRKKNEENNLRRLSSTKNLFSEVAA